MELDRIIAERFSVRDFKDTPVEQEKIDAILRAMQLAPTAHNDQPQRVFVLKSFDAIEKIRACTKCAFNAPVVLMICADDSISWKNRYSGRSASETDAAIVTAFMMLKAHDLGLGSCWVHHYDPQKLVAAFDLPENILPLNLLPIGYAQDGAEPIPMHFATKEMQELVKIL